MNPAAPAAHLPHQVPDQVPKEVPKEVGVLGVGALASALVRALARVYPQLHFHLSPRGAAESQRLHAELPSTRHTSNQAVLDAADWVIVGVRPAQLHDLGHQQAQGLRWRDGHHALVLAAGVPHARMAHWLAPARCTRLMTGLAVQGGRSALCVYPGAEALQWLAAAGACWLPMQDEAHWEAATLAVCANAWWMEQLGQLSERLSALSGLPLASAQVLLAANMADVVTLLGIAPGRSPSGWARHIGSPGTYTEAGLQALQAQGAHAAWCDTLAQVYVRLLRNPPQAAPDAP